MTRQFMSMAEKRRFEHSQKEREKARRQRHSARRDWSDDETRTEFDCNPNLTVQSLAFMTGKTVCEIKKIYTRGHNPLLASAPSPRHIFAPVASIPLSRKQILQLSTKRKRRRLQRPNGPKQRR